MLIVEDDFSSELLEVYKRALELREHQVESHLPCSMKMKLEMILSRLRHPKDEYKRTIASLSIMPFTTLGVRKDECGLSYLVAITEPILFAAHCFKSNKIVAAALGKYAIAIPSSCIVRAVLGPNIHFVPLNNVHASERHFHHSCLIQARNPLNSKVETCWASVGPIVLNALVMADIASIFESCKLLLEQVDLGSRLCTPEHRSMSLDKYLTAKNLTYDQVFRSIYGMENEVVF